MSGEILVAEALLDAVFDLLGFGVRDIVLGAHARQVDDIIEGFGERLLPKGPAIMADSRSSSAIPWIPRLMSLARLS